MYIVRDKKTRAIIHVNPAPVSQHLESRDVYFKFDPASMEIGRTDARELPEEFDINEAGEIVVAAAAERTLSQQVAEGTLTLPATQKIIGEGASEQIVEKTISEQVDEGLIALAPNLKVAGDEIVELTAREMYEAGSIKLKAYKQARIDYFSALAFEKRQAILPDFKLQNAALGVYDAQTVANYKATVQAFRDEFHRIEALLKKARSRKTIEAVTAQYPTEIVVATPE